MLTVLLGLFSTSGMVALAYGFALVASYASVSTSPAAFPTEMFGLLLCAVSLYVASCFAKATWRSLLEAGVRG